MNNLRTAERRVTGPLSGRARIRLAAFDLDGTLIEPGGGITSEVRRAITRLRERGVLVVIVTGRMHRTAEPFALDLGLEGMALVSCNGAAAHVVRGGSGSAVVGDGVLWQRFIAGADAVAVVEFLAGRGLEPLVFVGDRLYAGHPDPSRTKLYTFISGVEPEYSGDLGELLVTRRLRPTKLLQIEDAERMAPLYTAASTRFGERLMVTTSYPFFLEFMHGTAGKGRGLARVCRELGVKRAEVVAFGDGMNDLDMLTWAGLGVAMCQGPAALLEAADAIIEGPPGIGVARFIEEQLLEGSSP